MRGGGRNQGNYTNPCLTMHQPWASLLVHGIKRVEGRSWPAPIRGRLWIHAASKVPDEATIKAMEDFYQEIYAVNGITDIKFPEYYPVSRLLGCVEVVGCLRCEELANWKILPEGVRLEGQTDFCWLCEQPKKLLIPFEMRGYQGVYNLERKVYDAAVRGLTPVEGPLPVKFPLPNPRDPFSLKPGSLSEQFAESKTSPVEKSSSLQAAIAGARAAATQFSKKGPNLQLNGVQSSVSLSPVTRSQTKRKAFEDIRQLPIIVNEGSDGVSTSTTTDQPNRKFEEESSRPPTNTNGKFNMNDLASINRKLDNPVKYEGSSSSGQAPFATSKLHPGSHKIFAAALRDLKPS